MKPSTSTKNPPSKVRAKPLSRPKGYRVITIDGEKWYWTQARSGVVSLVARHARTGNRLVADCNMVDLLQRAFGPGTWDELRERCMIEPRHVAGWLQAMHADD